MSDNIDQTAHVHDNESKNNGPNESFLCNERETQITGLMFVCPRCGETFTLIELGFPEMHYRELSFEIFGEVHAPMWGAENVRCVRSQYFCFICWERLVDNSGEPIDDREQLIKWLRSRPYNSDPIEQERLYRSHCYAIALKNIDWARSTVERLENQLSVSGQLSEKDEAMLEVMRRNLEKYTKDIENYERFQERLKMLRRKDQDVQAKVNRVKAV